MGKEEVLLLKRDGRRSPLGALSGDISSASNVKSDGRRSPLGAASGDKSSASNLKSLPTQCSDAGSTPLGWYYFGETPPVDIAAFRKQMKNTSPPTSMVVGGSIEN